MLNYFIKSKKHFCARANRHGGLLWLACSSLRKISRLRCLKENYLTRASSQRRREFCAKVGPVGARVREKNER